MEEKAERLFEPEDQEYCCETMTPRNNTETIFNILPFMAV